jgi:hypothetical protein
MNIYEILKTKPHNEHYLKRYVSFIKSCQQQNQNIENLYFEKHHICPKSKDMFPEYKNLKKYTWNECILTYRQHIIAHLMLYKCFNAQSQLLSLLYTFGQFHTKKLNLKSINNKTIEKIKMQLSQKRKGVFTRGYDSKGKPLVKDSTKKLLSCQKIKFYSNIENRKKQSEFCKGTTGRKSEKYSIAAKNRSEEHLVKISESVKKYYESLSVIEKKRINSGIYITPFGNFTSLTNIYRNYCLNNQKQFSIHSVKNNPYVNKSIIGKTPHELGFNFIPKNDPTISQYYVDLNLVRRPESSHPLWSELNDYLSQQKFLP